VVRNVIMEGFTTVDVAARGQSSVQHFVSCLNRLPALDLSEKKVTSQIVHPALRSMWWLLTTLLPQLHPPQHRKHFLDESVQLSVLILNDDVGGRCKIFEHLDQPQLQEFVKLMAISQTELLKYHDQVEPYQWEFHAQQLASAN